MRDWRRVLTELGNDVARELERGADSVRRAVGPRLGGGRDALTIAPYRGFGTPEYVLLNGRVLEEEPTAPSSERDPRWRNLLVSLRRFESDEVPGALVRARLGNAEVDARTDEEGYFQVRLAPPVPLAPVHPWQEVELELLEPRRASQPEPVRATGFALVPAAGTHFGVISDLDDTVVRTDATDLLRMARTVLFENARTRLPFAGVAAFYRALHAGVSGDAFRPIFYVSSSPWNLYPLLSEFLEHHDIPLGPLLLRDWGIDPEKPFSTGHADHKLAAIERILATYPTMPFVLIGDSGQEDPEIYRETVARHANRVLAVYIRNVSRNPERPAAIAALAQEVEAAGSTLLLVPDTVSAARHAAERGWIDPARLAEIAEEKREDKAEQS
jgi:phosphatidate phosphatase APP1